MHSHHIVVIKNIDSDSDVSVKRMEAYGVAYELVKALDKLGSVFDVKEQVTEFLGFKKFRVEVILND